MGFPGSYLPGKSCVYSKSPNLRRGSQSHPTPVETTRQGAGTRLFPPVCIQAVKLLGGLIATLFSWILPTVSCQACSGSFQLPVPQEPHRAHCPVQGPEAVIWVCYQPGAPTSSSQHAAGTDAYRQNLHACVPLAQARSPMSNITAEVWLQPFP